QNQYLGTLHETTLGLMNRLDLRDLLQALLASAAQMLDTSNGYLYLVEPDSDEMQLRVGVGIFADQIGYAIRRGEGVAGSVWQTGQSLAINEYASWPNRSAHFGNGLIRAVAGAPLKSGAQVVGVLGMAFVEPGRRFEPEQIDVLARFAQLASVGLDN